MTKSTKLIIKISIGVSILLIAGVISLLQNMAMVDSIIGQNTGTDNQSTNAEVGDVVEFTGVLTSFDAGCAVDAACYAVIDDKYKVETASGRRLIPEEDKYQYGMSNVWDEHVGLKVKVRAKKISETQYTLIYKEGEPMLYVLRIGEHMACSDYCPGPRDQEKYMKIIYEDISDPAICEQIGGTPYEYSGWGVTKICIAD